MSAPSDVLDSFSSGKITNLEKIAFLARIENKEIRKKLIVEVIKKASLAEIKKQLDFYIQSNEKLPRKKRCQHKAQINLGNTKNVSVIKRIIDTVLMAEDYQKYSNMFDNTDWKNINSVKKAFKIFLNVMDKQEQQIRDEG